MYAQGARANERSLALALTPAQAAWRKQQRGQLLAARSAAAVQDRASWGAAINASLREALDLKAPCVLGLCWPYHAEFDARALAAHLRARGQVGQTQRHSRVVRHQRHHPRLKALGGQAQQLA